LGPTRLYIGNTTGAATTAEFGSVNTVPGASPTAFQYYGLANNTSVTWGGNQSYKGTVYAPNAVFSVGGGGNNIYDYQGACVVNQIVLNGHFNFHYDEDLRRSGPKR
jgi:hypothetical protein